MRLTLWERHHVTALQAKLVEGGDLAKGRIGPLVLGQCIAVSHVQVRKGGQLPKAFGNHRNNSYSEVFKMRNHRNVR